MKTTDAAKTWKMLMVPHGDNHDMWIDPTNPKRFIVGNDGAATVTTDGGQTWTPLTQPTAQFYHVELTGDVPYHVCGAQQDNTTACVSSAAAERLRRDRRRRGHGLLFGGRRRERLHRQRPEERRHLLRRQLQRRHDAVRPEDRTAPADQPVPREPDGLRVEGPHGALPVDVPDRLLADRSDGALRRLAAPLEDDQRRPELDEDQPRPDAPRSEDARELRRPDHEGRDGRRNLRDDLHGRAVAEGRQPDLDRIRRRLRADHARRRAELEERHAEGSAGVRAHQPRRSLAVPAGHGVRRGEPLSARRLRALRLSHRRLRRDVDEDRQRHRAARLRARHPRRPDPRQAAVPRDRARHRRLVRRRGELAVAAAEPARRAGARHQGGRARPRDRHTRPRVLRDGRHLAAPPVGRADDRTAALQARGRAARPRPDAGHRLRAEAAGREGDDRTPRRLGQGHPHVQRHEG